MKNAKDYTKRAIFSFFREKYSTISLQLFSMTNPETIHCDIPSQMPKNLGHQRSFWEKKMVIEEHIIKKEKDLRVGGVCHNTQLEMQRVIEEEYASKTDPEVLQKLEKYLPWSLKQDSFTLDTFYNTIKIQKEYNDIIENNTHLVYSFFGWRKFPGRLKVDGIAGKNTGVILDFLLSVKEKRDKKISSKSETIKAILEVKDIREIADVLVQKIFKRFLGQLQWEQQKIDLSLDSMYDEITSIANEINLESFRKPNPFNAEVASFFKHFFWEREKWKKLIKILLAEATGKSLSDNERIAWRLEILSWVLWFTIDTAKNNSPKELAYKLEQLKKIPALWRFVSSFQWNSSEEISTYEQNFSKIIELIPKLAGFLQTKRVVEFFDGKMKPEIVYLLTNIDKAGTPEFQKRADGCIILFAEFIKTEILPSVEQIPVEERKQIMDSIFSISFLKDIQQTEHYKLVVGIVWDSWESYFPVVKSLLGLFQKLMGKQKFSAEHRKTLITMVNEMLWKGTFPEEAQKEIWELINAWDFQAQSIPKLQKLLAKAKVSQNDMLAFTQFTEKFILSKKDLSDFENELKEILSTMDPKEKDVLISKLQSYLEQTGKDVYSFFLWFLKSGTFKFSEDMFTQIFFNLAWDTIKTWLSEWLIVSTNRAREILLSGKNTYQQAKTPLWGGLDSDILEWVMKLLDAKSKQILDGKNAKISLSKQEILNVFYKEIEGYLQKRGITLWKEYIKYIVDSIVNQEIWVLTQDTKNISYLFDRGVFVSPKDENLMLIDFFVDHLYQVSSTTKGDIKVEEILTKVAEWKKLHTLLSVKILWKPLIYNLLYIAKRVPKSELKLILFDNASMLASATSWKLKERELTRFWWELLINILKKAKIQPNDDIHSLDFFLNFIQKSDLSAEDLTQVVEKWRYIFSLLESRKKVHLPPEQFWKVHGEAISQFSDTFFTLMQKFLRVYKKKGVDMLIDEKIYKSSSSLQWWKLEFMKWLESIFKYSNIFSSLFTLMKSGFDKQEAQREFLYSYFTNPENKEDFKKKVFTVVYKKSRD